MHVRDLTKSYGDTLVVDHVDIDFPEGRLTAMIGPNGAGKSTIMGMISRLTERDGGSVELMGRDILQWRSKDLARQLAILTQSNNVSMKLTVQDLVSLGRFPYSGNHLTREDAAKVAESISYMELQGLEHRFIDELSGGQRQRAFIAMVIAQDTRYVLLDEPTNSLDITYASRTMQTVRRLCDELGKTVIVVLHEINFAAFYADYICALVDGRVHTFGTVEEVMTKELLSEVYQVEFEIMRVKGKPLSIYY